MRGLEPGNRMCLANRHSLNSIIYLSSNRLFKICFHCLQRQSKLELRQLYGKILNHLLSSIIWYLMEESTSYGRKNFAIKARKSYFEYRFCCELWLATGLGWHSVSHLQQGSLDLHSLKAFLPLRNSISKITFLFWPEFYSLF